MKIPDIDMFYKEEKTPVYIRYGIGRDGFYFFEVVGIIGKGYAMNFISSSKEWKKFNVYLNKLSVGRRLERVSKVYWKLRKVLKENNMNYQGTFKFKPSTNFKRIN